MREIISPQRTDLGICPSLSLVLFHFQILGDRDSKGPYLANIALLLAGANMISVVHTSSFPTLLSIRASPV